LVVVVAMAVLGLRELQEPIQLDSAQQHLVVVEAVVIKMLDLRVDLVEVEAATVETMQLELLQIIQDQLNKVFLAVLVEAVAVQMQFLVVAAALVLLVVVVFQTLEVVMVVMD
jgi:hypothetical protein